MIAPNLVKQFPRVETTADGVRAFDTVWASVEKVVMWYAWERAQCGDDVEDLKQEAMLLLLRLGPTRFNLRDRRDMAYVTTCLLRRMARVYGKKRNDMTTYTEDVALRMVAAQFPGALDDGPKRLAELCG